MPVEDRAQVLLPRPKGRARLVASLREVLCEAAERVGIEAHIVPHQLRHTYATSMLRAGVSLPALMKLLGHHNANMTLLYVEVTQQDLQREFHAARLQPRHRAPVPPSLEESNPAVTGGPASVPAALSSCLRLLDLYLQGGQAVSGQKQILLLARRIARIRSLFEKLTNGPAGEK